MARPDRRTVLVGAIGAVLALAIAAGVALAVLSTDAERVLHTRPDAPPAGDAPDATAGYTVTMSPVGAVRFTRPPERVVTQDANYNDMLVAVDRSRDLLATGYQNNHWDGFYRQLTGVEGDRDPAQLLYLSDGSGNGFDKELLYTLRADIHHIDPIQLARSRSWTAADVDEIASNVAPFFANRYSRENIFTGDVPYAFYSVWELAAKVGEVYRRADRVEGLRAIGEAMTRRIQARLPPPDQRPRVALIYYGRGRITPFSMRHGGFGQAQYVAVGARDAFEGLDVAVYGESAAGAALDLEGLVSIDPDVIIMPFAIYSGVSGNGARAAYDELLQLADDPLGGRLGALATGRVYPGGTPLQGPLYHLFQIEMAAKQIYPALFGPYRDDQDYPPDERLFDRDAVARIVRGEAAHGGE